MKTTHAEDRQQAGASPVQLGRFVRGAAIVALLLALTALHQWIGAATHLEHAGHVLLTAADLLVILAAGLWLGPSGGLAVGVGVALLSMAPAWSVREAALAARGDWSGSAAAGCAVGLLVGLRDRERAGIARRERLRRRESSIRAITSLAAALGVRDRYTRQHCERVARLAAATGRELGVAPEEIEELRLAGAVHDLGKVGVPDDVLRRPGELTEAQRREMERHPSLAAEILRHLEDGDRLAEIVQDHHECPDGTGYPRGLREGQIGQAACILRVADVYAALTEARPYKDRFTPERAIVLMASMSGRKLDARVFEALCGALAAGADEATEVREEATKPLAPPAPASI
jgi:putative nucleotidyltransferase with HDIG domain